MKKLIYLFLILFTAITYGQADFPEGIQISGGQPTVTSVNFLTGTDLTGLQVKISPVNLGFASDANVIHKTGNESFSGLKSGTTNGATATTGFIFTNNYNGGVGNGLNAPFGVVNNLNGVGYAGQNNGVGILFSGFNTSTGILNKWDSASGSFGNLLETSKNLVTTLTINHAGEINTPKISITGGTAAQYLKADGSVSTLTNPITGTGTTNFVPKFTAATTVGNSMFYDNGTMIGLGTSSPNYYVTSFMTGNNYFQWTNTSTGTGGLDGLVIGVDNASGVQILNRENTIMSLWSNNSIIQRLFPSGGTSFGSTTDPGANNLLVAGNAIASTPTAPTHLTTKAYVDALARPYKVYTALLNQTGTSAPTVTILENTLGVNITWSYNSTGNYYGARSAGTWTNLKTWTVGSFGDIGGTGLTTTIKVNNTAIVEVNTLNSGSSANGLMSRYSIEIREYP